MPNLVFDYYNETDEMINPYGSNCCYDEIKCDYVIPTPDILCKLSTFDVPPPVTEVKQKYTYTLKNGQTLELDHPLPPGFPIEMIGDADAEQRAATLESLNEDKRTLKNVLIYGTVLVCPFSGFLFYWYYMKKDKKLAKRIEKLTLTSFTVIGSILLLLL